jgi:diadenylate cyclase
MLHELLNWKAVAEVVILAVAYFVVLASIRGTRGANLLKGVVFVSVIAFLGLLWVANLLGFERIRTLLQGVLAGSFIAIIVIFAPEMRRGLLRLAQAPFLAPLIHGPSFKIVDELVNACVKLSKNRIGALLAIEREVGLGEYIENGQRLDADVSADLLEAIFYPGNPLHDGAVIIQHDKIAAAACLFPLSEDPNLSRTMGTRHRAAIGLSEESDALVIVVSEETGRISLCAGGKITADLSRESLDKTLRELVSRSGRSTLSFRWGRGGDEPPASPAGGATPSAPAGGSPPSGNGPSSGNGAAPEAAPGEAEGDARKPTQKRKKS